MRHRFPKIVLSLTGILLLVITLLPHHHHFHNGVEIIHFTTQQNCEEYANELANKHNDAEEDCEHSDKDCDLRQLFLMAGGRVESEHQNCHCHDSQSHIAHLYIVSFVTQLPNTDISNLKTYESPPFVNPLHSESLVFDVNRRGPPFFVA